MKTNSKRPHWDKYFFDTALLVASRSTCLRRTVGAVLVKDKRILATGYNGAPCGISHCEFTGCLRELRNVPSGERHELCRGLHAEQNVLLQAALHGVCVQNSSLYITHAPCSICAKMIINAGIKEIIYGEAYPDQMAEEFLQEAHILCRKFVQEDNEQKRG